MLLLLLLFLLLLLLGLLLQLLALLWFARKITVDSDEIATD